MEVGAVLRSYERNMFYATILYKYHGISDWTLYAGNNMSKDKIIDTAHETEYLRHEKVVFRRPSYQPQPLIRLNHSNLLQIWTTQISDVLIVFHRFKFAILNPYFYVSEYVIW